MTTYDSASSILILGGTRSGKSRFAQTLAEAEAAELIFIATAEVHDVEMANRISRHIDDRGDRWTTIESPLDIHAAIEKSCKPGNAVLLDCLTIWLSNIMHAELDVDVEVANLAKLVRQVSTPLFLISNEVGAGIIPDNPLGRHFCDEQGRLNQLIAAACDQVVLMTAGLPLKLKG